MAMDAASFAGQAWRPSRFNFSTSDADGAVLLYNSYRGALARIPTEQVEVVSPMLAEGFEGFPSGLLAELVLNGFFVKAEVDELHQAQRLHEVEFAKTDVLQLILLPNENCNFRCTYCYESFARNRMERRVQEGILRYVERRAPGLAALNIGWFGGEPLAARAIVEEMSENLQAICREHDVRYSSNMATNGYLLTRPVAEMLFRSGVRYFQITVDGDAEHHDRHRIMANGRVGTFERIYANLLALRAHEELFRVLVRVNFDPASAPAMNGFIDKLDRDFGGDPRFMLDFHPVGRWGGPNDERLKVCGADEGRRFATEFAHAANERGFDLTPLRAQLKPFGSRCYAANPRSFVVGANGVVYKCTVAFEDPRNHVGRMTDDGQLEIDEEKHALWISSGEEKDTGCQQCHFRPACHGNACPKERMDVHYAPCPPSKLELPGILRALSADMRSAAQLETGA